MYIRHVSVQVYHFQGAHNARFRTKCKLLCIRFYSLQ